MSRTVAQAFGRKHRTSAVDGPSVDWPDSEQLIGIEIELENYPMGRGNGSPMSVFPHPSAYWQRVEDHSLINGAEWKLAQPLNGSRLAQAIHEFFLPPTRTFRSVSSGTHIHINMDEDTTPVSAVQAVAALVYTIEPALFDIIDAGRRWSGFTNPLDSASSALLYGLFDKSVENDPYPLTRLCERNHSFKYYGLNIQPLGSYGTLEFRYFPTATSAEEVIDWVSLVQSIKLAGMAHPTLETMVDVLQDEVRYTQLIEGPLARWASRILAAVPPQLARKRAKRVATLSDMNNVASNHVHRHGNLAESTRWGKFYKKKPAKVSKNESESEPQGARQRVVVGGSGAFARDGDLYLEVTATSARLILFREQEINSIIASYMLTPRADGTARYLRSGEISREPRVRQHIATNFEDFSSSVQISMAQLPSIAGRAYDRSVQYRQRAALVAVQGTLSAIMLSHQTPV